MQMNFNVIVFALIGLATVCFLCAKVFWHLGEWFTKWLTSNAKYNAGYKDGCKDMAEYLKEHGNLTDEQITLLHDCAEKGQVE